MNRLATLLVWFATPLGLVFLGVAMWLDAGQAPVTIPPWAVAVPVVAAVFALAWAWQARKLARGDRAAMSPLVAARVGVMCQACLRGGAAMAGGMTGVALAYLNAGDSPYLTDNAFWAGLTALASLALAIVGWVGEIWCTIDDSEGPDASGAYC